MRFPLILCLLCASSLAQDSVFVEEASPYEAGMFQPAPEKERAVAIALLNLKGDDDFIEIGCGDGRVIVDAILGAPEGCMGTGVEIEPAVAAAAQLRVRSEGLEDRIRIYNVDARLLDLSSFTAVYVYLPTFVLEDLAPKLKGKRVVSVFHEIPGLPKGERFQNVWLYRGSESSPAKPVKVAEQKTTSRPVLTVVMSPRPGCQGCDNLKADIAAGKLDRFDIQYSDFLQGSGYPEIRGTSSYGTQFILSGWPSWNTLNSYFPETSGRVSSPAVVRMRPPEIRTNSSDMTWTWKGRTYSLNNYASNCPPGACPMCDKWRQLRAMYR